MVPGSGVPVNSRVVGVLAYAGGLLSGLLVLALERKDSFVRFHAMQSVVAFGAVVIAHLMLRGLGTFGAFAGVPFALSVVVLWIALMFQAFRGERYHLPYLGAFAEHLLK